MACNDGTRVVLPLDKIIFLFQKRPTKEIFKISAEMDKKKIEFSNGYFGAQKGTKLKRFKKCQMNRQLYIRKSLDSIWHIKINAKRALLFQIDCRPIIENRLGLVLA